MTRPSNTKARAARAGFVSLCALASSGVALALQSGPTAEGTGRIARFGFDGDTQNSLDTQVHGTPAGAPGFSAGLTGSALRLRPDASGSRLVIEGEDLPHASDQDVTVQFWIRTQAADEARMLILSSKSFPDYSLATQRHAGWAFLCSHGTWAWNMGSGTRRLCYERDNGARMPINDGRWHQLAMTFDSALSLVHLYYDGECRAVYNVHDAQGFDFSSEGPLLVGGPAALPGPGIVPAIEEGAERVQELVDAFHALGVGPVAAEELGELVVQPRRLYARKLADQQSAGQSPGAPANATTLDRVERLRSALTSNPYTIHQAFSFMEVAPLLKLYSLVDGRVVVDAARARAYSDRERLHLSDFDIDELTLWDRPLSGAEVRHSYAEHFLPRRAASVQTLRSITVGVWNIFHGGLHYTVEDQGWDSRLAIAQIIEREALDIVLLQETYSAGDFIAAELGYHFATTVDWDYLNQGSNISVLSRYPIVEVRVPEKAPFMNVAARISISATQDLWVMSNWYGMERFPDVADFHASRFAASDTTPVLFGGDFNAIPPSDGGESLAATTLLDQGFTDAFRSLHADVDEHPGHTHRSGRRIDQLFYKGTGLENTSTRVVRTWPSGFPSDHFLIRAAFDLQAPK